MAEEKLSQHVVHFVGSPANLGRVSFGSFALLLAFDAIFGASCWLTDKNVDIVSSAELLDSLEVDKYDEIKEIVSWRDGLGGGGGGSQIKVTERYQNFVGCVWLKLTFIPKRYQF